MPLSDLHADRRASVAPQSEPPERAVLRERRADLGLPIARSRHAWTINGDFLGLEATGVARYGREVTLALDDLIAAGHP